MEAAGTSAPVWRWWVPVCMCASGAVREATDECTLHTLMRVGCGLVHACGDLSAKVFQQGVPVKELWQ